MKLWRIENGYMGYGPVYVLVIAETAEDATRLARQAFEAHVRGSGQYGDDYAANLREPTLLCADTTQPWASIPHD